MRPFLKPAVQKAIDTLPDDAGAAISVEIRAELDKKFQELFSSGSYGIGMVRPKWKFGDMIESGRSRAMVLGIMPDRTTSILFLGTEGAAHGTPIITSILTDDMGHWQLVPETES